MAARDDAHSARASSYATGARALGARDAECFSEDDFKALEQLCAKAAKLVRGASAEQIRSAVHGAGFNLSRAVEGLRAEVVRSAEERGRADREAHKRHFQDSGETTTTDVCLKEIMPLTAGARVSLAAVLRHIGASDDSRDSRDAATSDQVAGTRRKTS